MTTASAIHDYDSAVAFLMGRINYERAARIPYRSRQFKLKRMERLLELIDNPHYRLPAIHVAGTKGKGSTAAMIESMLRAAGYRTGLYTSPHLERVEERFALNGMPCNDAVFVRAAQIVKRAVRTLDQRACGSGSAGPTYFEITTAIAMWLFAEAGVDFAVLEVGLGGRLDSTNVCRPVVSVITSISFDHTKQLGNSLTAIAREKAGIIKPGAPVIGGAGNDEASRVIRAVATAQGCRLRELNADFGIGKSARRQSTADDLTYWCSAPTGRAIIDNLTLAMLGEHQTANAALAVACVGELKDRGFAISESAIREGLAGAVCPARVELISANPPVILDAAHNVASCRALVAVLDGRFPHFTDRTLILATSNDKDARGMLRVLLPHFQRIIFTRFQTNPRAANPAALHSCAAEVLADSGAEILSRSAGTDLDAWDFDCAESPASALALYRPLAGKEGLLCVAGSFFLAGEMRPLLRDAMKQSQAVPAGAASNQAI